MDIHVRPIAAADAEICGRTIYAAFKSIAEHHQFRPDYPSAELGIQVAHFLIEAPSVFGVVAESEGQVVGSCFLSEYDPIRAVGPVTVDPAFQGRGVGRRLMEAVLERAKGSAGIRLVQDAFNMSSLSLYASLGFEVKEPLVLMEGTIEGDLPSGVTVRPMNGEELTTCGELCRRVHGFERSNEIKEAPAICIPLVALQEGRIIAYLSAPNVWPLNHGVAETEGDLQALLVGAAARSSRPLAFLVPIRRTSLFQWCLKKGMRLIKPLTLMAMGQYQQPRGSYLPSVGF
jgi:predicted N-acetyltransferase YhbS